jgi:L-ascorbate metabolism protein UlaG (beta-lactamase superfamily)
MVIEWLGHSCFKITLKSGLKILLDPYSAEVGYATQDVEVDIVTISHGHDDHNDLSYVKGDYTLVNTPGVHTFGELTIEGFETWHDHSHGAHRGKNIVYKFSVRGINVCHMGDIGCIPDEDLFGKLCGTDILMIPVGGNFTIDAHEALSICERIEPNIIIPMHFKTPDSRLDIAPLHEFLEAVGREYDVSHHGQCYLNIDKASLKKRTRVVVMEYL